MVLADLIKEILKTLTDVVVENPREKLFKIVLKLLYGIIMSFIVVLSSKPKEFKDLLKYLNDLAVEIADYDQIGLIPIERRYKSNALETEKETVHRKGHWVEEEDYERVCHNQTHKREKLEAKNAVLEAQLAQIQKKVAEQEKALEEAQQENTRLKLQNDSKTSHWPSSKDRYPKKRNYSNERDQKIEQDEAKPKQEPGKPGGKEGHKGYSGRVREGIVADKTIKCFPKGMDEKEIASLEWQEGARHQIVDIQTEVVITDYIQMETKIEGERGLKTLKGTFPLKAKPKTSYGQNLIRLIIIYYSLGLTSFNRIAEIFKESFGLSISKSSVKAIFHKACRNFRAVSALIARYLWMQGRKSGTIFKCDETPVRVGNDSKHWYDHIIVSDAYVHHNITPTRSLKATFDSGILEGFKGILITDFYPNYLNRTWTNAFCFAHLSRELLAASIRDPDSSWVKKMQSFEKNSYLAYRQALEKDQPVPEDKLKALTDEYYQAIETGNQEKDLTRDTQNLLERMKKYARGILLHLYDTRVSRTSNEVESQCRQFKRKQDMSLRFKSEEGAKDYAAIVSVIETAKKQGLNPIEVIDQTIGGNTYYLFTHYRDDSLTFKVERKMTTHYDHPYKDNKGKF